jgi:hypothetical protein
MTETKIPRRRRRRGEQPMVPDAEFRSYYGRPVLREPTWRAADIAGYLFLGGLAGASSVLAAGAELTNRPALAMTGKLGALVAISGSTAALVHDLGRPARFANMLRVMKPSSPMSVGSWILAPTAGAAAASVVLPGPLGDLAGLAAGTLAPGLASYTAILTSNTSVPLWAASRKALPALYVSSAASAAMTLLTVTGSSERAVTILDTVASVGELASGYAVEKEASKVERVGRPLHEGPSGDLWKASKIATLIGLVLTLLGGRRTKKVGAFFGLLGSVAAKFAIFRAGVASAHDPRATFEQQRASTG